MPRVKPSLSSSSKDGSVRYKTMSSRACLIPNKSRNLSDEKLSTPATTLGEALNQVPVPDALLVTGLSVKKLSLSSSKGTVKPRIITVSPDRHAIFLTHSAEDLQQQQPRQGFNDDDKQKSVAHSVASKLKVPVWTRSKGFGGNYLRYVDVADLTYVQSGAASTQGWEDYFERKISKSGKLSCLNGGLSEEEERKALLDEMVTIWHHGNRQFVPLLVPDPDDRAQLCKTIKHMMTVYESTKDWVDNEALLLRYIWYDIDSDRNSGISCSEFGKICQRINLELPNGSQMYKAYCKEVLETSKDINYRQCVSLLRWCKKQLALDASGMKSDKGVRGFFSSGKNKKKTVEDRRPATLIWNEVFGEDCKSVSAKDLWKKFLSAAQGETDTTEEDAASLISSLYYKVEIDAADDDNEVASMSEDEMPELTKELFGVFLHSVWNDAFDPEAQLPPQHKLDKPLSHYWINSSHNTYLLGDQLRSRSSVEAYMQALLRGTKCLELDCWDGDEKVEDTEARSYSGTPLVPIVYHGHTLTSKIPFESICHVVENYMDNNPDSYPVILSLENHCSHAYQLEIAKVMRRVFGKRLYVPPEDLFDSDSETKLPSPESLRGRIIIKGKRPPEPEDDATEPPEIEKAASADTDASRSSTKSNALPKYVPELASLTLLHGEKFKSFDKSMVQLNTSMHSIGESKITRILDKGSDQGDQWRAYNVDHMTRTYPAGTRVDSSNYNPILAWAVGSQLVALNFQTPDTPLILNDGRFRQHGECGYLLKPRDVMGNENGPTEPKKITIHVLSGSCLPKPQGAATGEYIDPYVRVELHDVVSPPHSDKEEYKQKSFTTSVVKDNGFCPLWGKKQDAKTFKVHKPSVAMFLFSLLDDDVVRDDRVADAAIPVSCLRPGFRSIQLYGPNGTRSGPFAYATLLVKITMGE